MAIDDNTSYELTGAQVKDLANKIKAKAADNTFVGATSAAPGSKGLVPQPQAGDDTKFLSGDGTWKTAGGSSSYTAGNGIDIDANNEISIDTTVVAEVSDLPTDFTGATSSAAGTSGLVPAPAAGDQAKYLKGDGTWGTYDDPMIDEAACAIKPMSNAFAQEIADAYNDAHADPQDPSSYISPLNVEDAIPFMFVNQSGEPISTLRGIMNALRSAKRVVYNGTDDKFVSSHSSASGYAKFGLFDPLYSEVKNYKVRAGNSSDSPAFKQYLPYIIVLDEYGSQNAWGYTDGTESEDSLTDAPETKYQVAHDANGNLYMASDATSVNDWKQISNDATSITYYLLKESTAGMSSFTTYIYTDSSRTTVADPATLVDNFNAGKTILLEYEQTGAAEPYSITFQVNSASADGDPATQCQYKLLISELNEDNGNYNVVTTQLSATVTAGTTFGGTWGVVRAVIPSIPNFNYSTSEISTGTIWIDNKPIYKKTVSTGAMPNNTRKQVAHGISNLGFIISMSGAAYGSSTFVPIPYTDTTASSSVGLFADSNNIILFTGANMSYLTTSYVTLYYTKTTD